MKVSSSFIHSVYASSVCTLVSGSDCAAKLASGMQYARQTCQPFPVSQASKNCFAPFVIPPMCSVPQLISSRLFGEPDVLHAPAIIDAVDHDGQVLYRL